MRESAETVYVASKIPPKNLQWPAPPGVRAEEVFPADWIVSCTERSLQNLGLETIDVQQFHVWSDEWVGQGDWLDAIERLKRDGKIRFFGVSINDHQPENAIRLVESGLVDTVQVIYNVFDQSPEDALFPAVEAAGVGVIVRVPFDEGALTGSVRPETTFPEGDFRNRYFAGERKREVWERVAGDRPRPRRRGRAAGGDRAPLLPQPPGGERRHPGHALDPQRRAKRARRLGRPARGEPTDHAPPPSLGRRPLPGVLIRPGKECRQERPPPRV